jgi:hypothetical protein
MQGLDALHEMEEINDVGYHSLNKLLVSTGLHALYQAHRRAARAWLAATLLFGALTLGVATTFLFVPLVPPGAANAAPFEAFRVTLLPLMIGGVAWASSHHKENRRLASQAASRQVVVSSLMTVLDRTGASDAAAKAVGESIKDLMKPE